MSLSGLLLIFYSSRYIPLSISTNAIHEDLVIQTSAEHFVTLMTGKWKESLEQLSISLKKLAESAERTEESEYIPSVLKYNLVNIFPENGNEADYNSIDSILNTFYKKLNWPIKNKAMDSYGGQIYEALNHKDAEWTSALYKWIQATPEQAAARKSLPSLSVIGRYNPENPRHEKEDSTTWLIPSWKNVTVNFYDGDGMEIDLYSNTQDILSIANVHTFYIDWQDLEAFKSYTNDLWDVSHSYNVDISDVYYCDGCETITPINESPSKSVENGTFESNTDITSSDSVNGSETVPTMPQGALPETGKTSENETTVQHDSAAETASTAKIASAAEAISTDEATSTANSAAALPASDQNMQTQAGESVSEVILPTENSTNPEITLNAEGKFCSGHVDLSIDAKIVGLTEANNLFRLDQAASIFWTPYRKAYAYQIFTQDWSDQYNLSTMKLGMGKPLTSGEIAEYMEALPPDLSLERKAVINYALNSVGKIPYYYGGKPKATGYEDNFFSSPVKPDQKGRILSGLDCSGWINWVYWSAIEKKPASLGTGGLIHEGRGISRENLQPGDIIVKAGLNSHVVMFLNWASDGSMICIHEVSGATNNVTVSTLNLNWPYYRTILN